MATSPSPIQVKDVQSALQVMADADHEATERTVDGHFNHEAIASVYRQNPPLLKQFTDEFGWITRSTFGDEAADNAWLVAQHGDLYPETQRQWLDMVSELGESEVKPHDVAYLTDRVLTNEQKPQRYGTQYSEANGNLILKPVEDLDKLDDLRVSMGLDTIAQHGEITEREFGQKLFRTAEEAEASVHDN